MNQLPHYIELRQSPSGILRAFIVGTRVRVQDIHAMAEFHGYSPTAIVDGLPHLSLAQVHAALAYYHEHAAEIQYEIEHDRELIRKLREETGPGPLEHKLAKPDAVSS